MSHVLSGVQRSFKLRGAMASYVVRLREGGQLAGIFWAAAPFDLHEHISEVADPAECEYSTLPPGGIIWPLKTAAVPILGEHDSGDEQVFFNHDPILWGPCEASESLRHSLRDADSLWLPLPNWGSQWL